MWHWRPNRFPNCQIARSVIVSLCESFGSRDVWAVSLVEWTGSTDDVLSLCITCRWFWDIKVMQCQWCSLFHVDFVLTDLAVSNERARLIDEESWYVRRLKTYCHRCATRSLDVQVDEDSHSYCRRCLGWVRQCEHIVPY
jgi:hypothetical protein